MKRLAVLLILLGGCMGFGAAQGSGGGSGSSSGAHTTLVTSTNPTTISASTAEYVLIDTSGGSVSCNLDAVASFTAGQRFVFKRVGGNSAEVVPNGSEQFDDLGAGSFTLSSTNQVFTIVKLNGAWKIENSYVPE